MSGEKRAAEDAGAGAPPAKRAEEEEEAVYSGGCFCGEVAFEARGAPLFRCLCHCVVCQRWSGAPSTAFVGFPGKQLAVTKGAEALISFATSDNMTRYRCGKCGCPVYNQSTSADFDFRDAPLGSFARDEGGQPASLDELRPTAHIWCSSRVRGITKADPDGIPKFLGHFGASEKTDECV